MVDLVLHDISPELNERIQRLGLARGWTRRETVLHLLVQGLFSSDYNPLTELNEADAKQTSDHVLADAIKVFESLPSGKN